MNQSDRPTCAVLIPAPPKPANTRAGRLRSSRLRARLRNRRPHRGWFVAAVAIAVLVAAAGGWALGGGRNRHTEPFDISGLDPSLTVGFDQTPQAGRAALLNIGQIRASDAPQTRISVLHTSGAGAYRTEHWVTVVDGQAQIPVATLPMREAGSHSFIVFTDQQFGELEASVDPKPPQAGFIPVIGPTRVTANGTDLVVVTINPHDQFGNGLADGTAVSLEIRRPDGVVDEFSGTIESLLAGIEVPATSSVGTAIVVATIDGIPSEPVEFEQVPGPPAKLQLSPDEATIVADGRSVVAIRANEIADSDGNQVVDGTTLTATFESASGGGTVDAVSVNGEAVFLLRAPTAPGPIEFTVRTQDRSMTRQAMTGANMTDRGMPEPTTTLTATAAVESFEAVWDRSRHELRVGPVTAPTGGFVADGAKVYLSIDGSAAVTGQVLDGFATLAPPPSRPISATSTLDVTILGVTRTVPR